jgi:hypothetical protein
LGLPKQGTSRLFLVAMAEEQKAAIPKFTSFKPKPAVPANPPQSPDEKKGKKTRPDRRERRKDGREEKGRQHRHQHHSDEEESSHRAKKSSRREIVQVRPKESSVLADDFESNLYRIDKVGDLANLTYRSLHRYSIPLFRRVGYGSVLGADPRKKIDRDLSNEKQIVLQEQGPREGYTRRLLAKPNTKDTRQMRIVRPKLKELPFESEQDFVLIATSRKRKRGSESPEVVESLDYRSIEGKAKPPAEPADTDLEYTTGSSEAERGDDDEAGALARTKHGELIRKTKEHPEDITAWLTLIDHQVALLGGPVGRTLSVSEKWSLADIRVSIYETALQKIGKDPDARSTLWIGLLKEGASVWEANKLAGKWQEVLQTHPGNLKIWTEYLDFIQSHASEFRYERCKSEYAKCLQILADAMIKGHGVRKDTSNHDQISNIFSYVYLRLTLFMQEAGYHEHAEALWQAILEISFFVPPQLRSDITSDANLVASFEAFWESEVPRIGEANAAGWSDFSDFAPENQDVPDAITTEVDVVTDVNHLYKRFATAESGMVRKLNHPGRSADEAGEDDPYHIIFFSDLGPLLSPTAILRLEQKHLLRAFLCYLGLPAPSTGVVRDVDDWWLDPFVRRLLASKSSGSPLLPYREVNTEVLFSDAFEGIELSDPLWVRRSLRKLVEAVPGDDLLAEISIAFDFHFFPETYVLSYILLFYLTEP